MSIFTILDESYRVAWGDLCYTKENLPEVLLTSLIGPMLYLLAFGYGVGSSIGPDYLVFIIPGIVGLTTLSATFSTVSMKILVQRLFYMSFDELLLCPIHISSVIIGKTLSGVIRALLSCTILLAVGWILAPSIAISPLVFVVILASSFMFSLLGMLAGMLTRKTQSLSLFSSIVIVPMTFLCGTLFDVSALPDFASYAIYCLPLTHVSQLMRALMLDYAFPWDSVVFIILYTTVFFYLCYWLIKNSRC